MRMEYIERGEGTVVLVRGAWASGEDYAYGNLVQNSDRWWFCYTPHTAASASEPGVGASYSSYWYPWGLPGDEAYLYIGYASDDSGSDFSTSPSSSLHYVAFLSTDEPIASPQASDFAGLWKEYKGQTGAMSDFKGLWSSVTTYQKSDGVLSSGGRGCISKVNDNLNHAPPSYPDTENDYWYVFAERGSITNHHSTHDTGGADAITALSAAVLTSGSLDGDRLPAPSSTKRGGVKATGTPSGLFLRDDDTWAQAGSTSWTQETHFAATPASTSTLTMTEDETATIKVGYGLKYTISGVTYYGIVTAITSGLLTIAGAPLSSTVSELYWCDASRVIQADFFVPGAFADAANTGLLASDARTKFRWSLGQAYCVQILHTVRVDDSGANQPRVTISINGSVVGTDNSSAGQAVAETWTPTVVGINVSNYDINTGEAIEIVTDDYGSNNDATDLTVSALFVIP